MWVIVEINEEEFVEVELGDEEWDVEDLSEDSKSESNTEESNDAKSNDQSLNEKVSVSSTPLKWVHMRKKVLCCYWPKTDAAIKIRSGEVPKGSNDENWSVHRCRMLMNGETFESYKSAREAEKISANCSTMTEYRERFGRKRKNRNDATDSEKKNIKKVEEEDAQSEYLVCSSTMDFDVESVLEETSSSDKEEKDNILDGNDTYKYNEVIKYKGEYLQNNVTGPNEDFERYTSTDEEYCLEKSTNGKMMLKPDKKDDNTMKNDQDETFVINQKHSPSDEGAAKYDGESEDSERSDYNQFKLTSDKMLTSTLLEEVREIAIQPNENSEIIANRTKQNIFTGVAKIELMVSTFNSNIHDELRQLKEFAKLETNEEPVLIPVIDVYDTVSMAENHFPNASSKIETLNAQELNDKSVPSLISKLSDPDIHSKPKNNVVSASSKIEILNVQELNAPVNSDEFEIEVSSAVTENTALGSVIELPIMDKPHFEKNDALVEQDTLEDALVAWLLPLVDEQEVKYMDRVVDILFNEKFFVDCITWKIGEKDPKRVLIKFTNILICWKRSYETTFPPDDKDNTKFMAHCRRIKGKKRAAKKSKIQVAK